jgi:hypothetical protein
VKETNDLTAITFHLLLPLERVSKGHTERETNQVIHFTVLEIAQFAT